jgi:hypothetical protein
VHLYRNGQFIGCDNIPGLSFSSSRGTSDSHLKSIIHCELSFNPTSIQNNIMDKIANIQTNKNQRTNELPVQLLRIIQHFRDIKYDMLKKHYLKHTILVKPSQVEPVHVEPAQVEPVIPGHHKDMTGHVEKVFALKPLDVEPVHVDVEPVIVKPAHVEPSTAESTYKKCVRNFTKLSTKETAQNMDDNTRNPTPTIDSNKYTIDTIAQHPDVRTILEKICTFTADERNRRLHHIILQLNEL